MTAAEFVDNLMEHCRDQTHSVLFQVETQPWTADCQNCGWTAQEPPP